jgi:tetratricopeptide (TPR) repeat protein
MACFMITRSARTPVAAALIGAALNLAACAHWQSHADELSTAAASIQLIESGSAPANCRALGEISAHRGALQNEGRVDIDLRNAAAAMHGDLVVITERTTLSAKGQVHQCSTPAPAPPPPPNTTEASAERIPVVRTSSSESSAPRASGLEEVTLDQRAHELFVLGRDAYLAQRYEDALRYFRAALQLSGRYELQYNIGQAADRLHRNPEALEAFQSFLADAPPSQHRSEIEARVAVLRGGH